MILLEATFDINDFFTPGSLTTLGGATLIVFTVCGAIQQAFNFSPKWLALVISMIISFIGVAVLKPDDMLAYLYAFLNGFLIYMTATGANQLTANGNPTVNPAPPAPVVPSANLAPPANPAPNVKRLQKRSFNSNWWNK